MGYLSSNLIITRTSYYGTEDGGLGSQLCFCIGGDRFSIEYVENSILFRSNLISSLCSSSLIHLLLSNRLQTSVVNLIIFGIIDLKVQQTSRMISSVTDQLNHKANSLDNVEFDFTSALSLIKPLLDIGPHSVRQCPHHTFHNASKVNLFISPGFAFGFRKLLSRT